MRLALVNHTADGGIAKNLCIHKAHKEELSITSDYAEFLVQRDMAHLLESTIEDSVKNPGKNPSLMT